MQRGRWIGDARTAATRIVRMVRDPLLALWGLYLLAVPIYVFKSGLPQPGDYLILMLAPALFGAAARQPTWVLTIRRALLAFTIYVVATNLIWSAALGNFTFSAKEGFLLSPLFYIYNAIMFFVVVAMYQRYGEQFLWFTAKLILVSLVIQMFVASFWVTGGTLRTVGMFNNANQLGFFALLSASLLLILQRARYASTLEVTIGVLAATYLCLLSASKAALGAIALLAIFGVFVRLRTMLVVSAALALSMVVATPMFEALERAVSRIERDSHAHSAIEERGYDRIINNPEYLVTGAGEGAYTRFAESTVIGSHEIHSSLGTLVFCYGVIGLGLFAAFVWLVIRRTGLRMWLLVAPAFAYSMTHQGLRSTLFWVELALIVAIRWQATRRRT